ncbi:uncharacterized protein LOC111636431 [Centruroides sculpturatus]|uniref:uncharacterized protein LOC111636431 n=1 Tax=Centruroides sculpturatus TaxID=218467 RepID=UPI000C6CF4A2|nr:uncharacterized protein LOC111636431 [Centruroides sculpturatus]
MKMKLWKLGKRILAFGFIIIFTRWIFTRKVHFQQQFTVDMLQSSKAVWDFIADLNHMKVTNPGLKTFEIISDSGSHQEWQYSAILTEYRDQFGLVNIPAEFTVKPQGKDYLIISTYNICKFFICAHVNSTMTFKENEDKNYKTKVIEDVDIVLSYIFSWYINISKIETYHKEKLLKISSHLNNNKLN